MPTLNEKIADRNITHAISVLRFDAGIQNRSLSFLRTLEKKLVARTASFDFGTKSAIQKRRLRELISYVRQVIASEYKDISDNIENELIDLSAVEVKHAAKSVNNSISVELIDTAFTKVQLKSIVTSALIPGNEKGTLMASHRDWMKRLGGDLLQRYTDTVRFSVLEGLTNEDIVKKLKDDAFPSPRRSLRGHVRTSVQTIANDSKNAVWEENEDLIKGVQQLSTLDSKTSNVCVARSGLLWTLPDHKPKGHSIPWNGGPPLHPNCRSTTTPVIKSFRELGIEADELPKSTRASIDGQVSEDLTFDGFLKTKSEGFQNRVLGRGKAELWRKGEINLTDLLDFRGNPKTLQDIQKDADIITPKN